MPQEYFPFSPEHRARLMGSLAKLEAHLDAVAKNRGSMGSVTLEDLEEMDDLCWIELQPSGPPVITKLGFLLLHRPEDE